MFLINGMKATLRQFNREEDNAVFDDQNYRDITIKCCPFDVDSSINFGVYTHPEATGYYQVPNWVDVKEGDQIQFLGKFGNESDNDFHTILKVSDGYLFNNIENYIIAVK